MLDFSLGEDEGQLIDAILACGKICYDRRLLTANDGNISVRLGTDRVLITTAGVCKGRMGPGDVIQLDLKGRVIGAGPGRKPSSETPMHLEVYRRRPDVHAVIHAHPVFATTLSVSDIPFPVDVLPEILLTLGDVPTTRYATPSSHDDAEAIRDLILEHDALLLRQHGTLTLGSNLEVALVHLERIEHVAEVFWRAQMLGKVALIPDEEKSRLVSVRKLSREP